MTENLKKDIDERKKTEELLLQSNEDWEDTFDTITDMIIIHDKDLNIVRSNKAAKQMFNLPSLEINKVIKCCEYHQWKGDLIERCPSHNSLKTGIPAIFEIFEPDLDMFFEVRAIPRFDCACQPKALIHIVRDITERKRFEEKIQLQLKRLNPSSAVIS